MDKSPKRNRFHFRFRKGVSISVTDERDGAILTIEDIDGNFIDPMKVVEGIADKLEAQGMSRRSACCVQDDACDAIVKSMQVEFLRELLEP